MNLLRILWEQCCQGIRSQMGLNIRAVHSVMNVREMCHALTGDHALQSKMISQKKKCLVLTDVLYRLSKMPDTDADVDANANALLTLGGYSDQPQPVFAVSSSNLIHTYSYLSLIISKGSNLWFFFILNWFFFFAIAPARKTCGNVTFPQ